MNKCCIINFAKHGWYPTGQERLRDSLSKVGFFGFGDFLSYGDESEINSLTHEVSPYAFKLGAFNKAIGLGYRLILWCDSSLWSVRKLSSLFAMLNERG